MKKIILNKAWEEWIVIALFIALSLWWVVLFFVLKNKDIELNLVWGASYQIIALLGSVFGFFSSKQWGGFRSVLGKAILMFSFGLLLQAFGQTTFSYYNLIARIEVPYPSISDIGFFGSIPFYIYGIILLGKASGVGFSLRSFSGKAVAIILPAFVLCFSYVFFLKGYQFDWTNPVRVALDFGYPLAQTIYVSLALITYILSKRVLGGTMRRYILIILLALVVQYFSDFNFLYQASNQTWINGGYGDYFYLAAYFIMAFGLVKLSDAFKNIKNVLA